MNKLSLSLLAIFTVQLMGCAIFNADSDLKDQGFYERATPARYAVPLPVEIARDIENISETGVLRLRPGTIEIQSGGLTPAQQANIDQSRAQQEMNQNQEPGEVVAVRRPNTTKRVKRRRKSNGGLRGEEAFLISKGKGPLMRSRAAGTFGPLKKYSGAANTIPTLPPLKGGKTITYIVKLGDTLMKIAFEKYANYLRWKDIYQINKNKMVSPRKMQVGTELTIENVKYVYIKKDGNPYLIRKNDTLKSISQKLYGTPDRWKEIWESNPQLIQNPKKIYAGFTLYYKPDSNETGLMRVPAEEAN